jgi:hypothetical protein
MAMTAAERKAKQRAAAYATGKCSRCCDRRARTRKVNGKTVYLAKCADCAAEEIASQRARREAKKAASLA